MILDYLKSFKFSWCVCVAVVSCYVDEEATPEHSCLTLVSYLQCLVTWAIGALNTVFVFYASSDLGNLAGIVRCLEGPGGAGELKACEEAVASAFSPSISPNSSHAFCDAFDRSRWTYKEYKTLVSDFDLLCGKEWLASFAMTMYFLGMGVGCLVWIWLADRSQRKRLLNMGRTCTGIFCFFSATAPMLWLLFIFRFFLGVSVSIMMISAFVLSYDVTGVSWRPYCIVFLQFGFALGACIAAFCAWALPRWRWLCIVAGILPILLTITTWSFMIESPQWLLEQGRKGEATSALAAIAFGNHSRPPDCPLADPVNVLSNPQRRLIDIARNVRLRRRFLLLSLAWVAIMVTYYSVFVSYDSIVHVQSSKNHSGSSGSGIELAFTGFAYEIVGVAIAALAVDRIGRKYVSILGLVECGAALMAASFHGGTTQEALIVASRLGLSTAIVSICILSWELFPSIVVYQGIGMLHVISSAAVIAAPWLSFSVFLLHTGLVALTICGSLCLGAAVIVTMLPDTLNTPIPTTIQELGNAPSDNAATMLIPIIMT